jgi:hypothetical protein
MTLYGFIALYLFVDFLWSKYFFQYIEAIPFFSNLNGKFLYKSLGLFHLGVWEMLFTFLFSGFYLFQFAILKMKFKNSLIFPTDSMSMNRLVVIGMKEIIIPKYSYILGMILTLDIPTAKTIIFTDTATFLSAGVETACLTSPHPYGVPSCPRVGANPRVRPFDAIAFFIEWTHRSAPTRLPARAKARWLSRF